MRERLIHGLIQGDRGTWAALGVLWALTALLVLLHRPGGWQKTPGSRAERAGPAFTWALLAMTTATSLAGLPLAAALAVPRVRWRIADAGDLLVASGETWRRLRGPVAAIGGTAPDLAIPTVDAADQWVLVELLSGKPAPGLPPAETAPAAPGTTRLCRADGSHGCRAWPVAWPDPARTPPQSELTWARGVPEQALAYDVETGLYLVRVDPPPPPGHEAAAGEAPRLEIVGRLGTDPPREGSSVLFVVRRIAGGRLRAARVVATPAEAGRPGHAFHLQRADVSLIAGPRAFALVARPILAVTSFALPLGILVHVLAPLALRARRARRDAGGEPLAATALRKQAAALVGPWLEAIAAFSAGLAAAAPAIVAIASLWGSR